MNMFDTYLNTFVENCNKKIREWWVGYKPIEVKVGETYKGFVKICWNVPEKFLFIYVNKETGTIHELDSYLDLN